MPPVYADKSTAVRRHIRKSRNQAKKQERPGTKRSYGLFCVSSVLTPLVLRYLPKTVFLLLVADDTCPPRQRFVRGGCFHSYAIWFETRPPEK